MPVCKLCKLEAKLIKAHIIPRSFWGIDPADPLKIVTNIKGEPPRKSRLGVYDTTILCEKCERAFSDYDSYATDLLINKVHNFRRIQDARGRMVGQSIIDVNYQKLKLFCIALLWRAGASSHSFFSKVRLGAFAEYAGLVLSRGDAGCPEVFGAIFAVWSDIDQPFHMDPFQERWEGINYYRFYLRNFIIYIKVDRRPTPRIFSDFLLSPEKPLIMISRNLIKSRELPLIRRIISLTPMQFQQDRGPYARKL